MPRSISDFLPSMFQRRLALLAAILIGSMVVLALQLVRLTVVQAEEMRQGAERSLVQHELIPTVRGRIYDRKGRLLASDRPSYDVAVHYRVLSGQWAYEHARLKARREHRSAWAELAWEDRQAYIASYQDAYLEAQDALWLTLAEVGGSTRTELEEKRGDILRRVQRIVTDVSLRQQQRRSEELGQEVPYADAVMRVREQEMDHVMLMDVSDAALARVRRRVAAASVADRQALYDNPDLAIWKQVRVRASRSRWYPLETTSVRVDRSSLPALLRREAPLDVLVEGVGLQVVGTLREVDREQFLARRFDLHEDLGGYLDGDQVGHDGVERWQEERLRGKRGYETRYLDSGRQESRRPEAGHDVRLAVDMMLQARIQGIMSDEIGLTHVQPWHSSHPAEKATFPQPGERLAAGAVVLDVKTGEVLASVTSPTYSLRMIAEQPALAWGDPILRRHVDRVLGQPYQPGSTIKPLVYLAAVMEGELGVDEIIDCKGHFYPDKPNQFRDWIYKQFGQVFGPLDAPGAMARSSNYFFYTLGSRLGSERLIQWYDRFGLGRSTGAGLGDNVVGSIPDLARADEPDALGFSKADAIFMSIGQGPVTWTLLQAASAYGTLARRGVVISPSFLLEPDTQDPDYRVEDLHIDPRAADRALRGLEMAVNEYYGTTNHLYYDQQRFPGAPRTEPIFNLPGVTVLGKSGTAEAAPLRRDADGDGRITSRDPIVREGDHAWFTGLVQRDGAPGPEYVVIVMVEFGGSGGKVAGPIANQVMHALRAEGYL